MDVLCQLLRLSPPTSSQASFAEADGVLALVALLSRPAAVRSAALKGLDFACLHQPRNVAAAIEGGGIKPVFALLTHRLAAKWGAAMQRDMEEHCLSTLTQWLLYAHDADLLRVVAKFTVSAEPPAGARSAAYGPRSPLSSTHWPPPLPSLCPAAV